MFSNSMIYKVMEFIQGTVSTSVREEFFYIWNTFAHSIANTFALPDSVLAKFFLNSNLVFYAIGISGVVFITKKAFVWFKGMAK